MSDFIYNPKKTSDNADYKTILIIHDENYQTMMDCDKRAKEAGSIVGQIYVQPWADGCAFYQAVEEISQKHYENLMITVRHQVKFQVCKELGDDWKPFGECFYASYKKAKTLVERAMFGGSKGTMLSKRQQRNPESYLD